MMAGRSYKLGVKLLWVENKVMKRKYPRKLRVSLITEDQMTLPITTKGQNTYSVLGTILSPWCRLAYLILGTTPGGNVFPHFFRGNLSIRKVSELATVHS